MSLLESLTNEQLEARKNKQELKLAVLQVAISAIKNEQIKKQKELEDEEVVQVLDSQVKQLRDAMKDFESGGRDDLIEKTKQEIDILSSFIPEKMSEEEIEEKVKKVIDDVSPQGPQDFGKVMGASMSQLKGKVDGELVGKVVRRLLA